MRVPAGTQTNGSPFASAAAATTRERAVAAGSAERVRTACDCLGGELREVVVRAQDDRVDAKLACPCGEAGTRSFASPGLRIHEENGPPRRVDNLPGRSFRTVWEQ